MANMEVEHETAHGRSELPVGFDGSKRASSPEGVRRLLVEISVCMNAWNSFRNIILIRRLMG
jgi:hypothetical protein